MAKRIRYADVVFNRECSKCGGSGLYMRNEKCWRCKGTRVETVTLKAHSQNVRPSEELIQIRLASDLVKRKAARRVRRAARAEAAEG